MKQVTCYNLNLLTKCLLNPMNVEFQELRLLHMVEDSETCSHSLRVHLNLCHTKISPVRWHSGSIGHQLHDIQWPVQDGWSETLSLCKCETQRITLIISFSHCGARLVCTRFQTRWTAAPLPSTSLLHRERRPVTRLAHKLSHTLTHG